MAEIKRAVRVAERVREELAELLLREVKDPRVRDVVISRIVMTDDLRNARVFVRLLDDNVEKREAAMVGLGKTAPMLRSAITKRAKLRFAPELKFQYDSDQDASLRIETLLEEVKRDREKR